MSFSKNITKGEFLALGILVMLVIVFGAIAAAPKVQADTTCSPCLYGCTGSVCNAPPHCIPGQGCYFPLPG